VHPSKWTDQALQAFLYERLFGVMPDTFPNLRELRIQIAKWQRLLHRPMVGGLALLGMDKSARKKWRKDEGMRDAQAVQQGKKVRLLAERTFKEWLRLEWAKSGHAYTNKKFRIWQKAFDTGMKESLGRAKAQFADRKVERLITKHFYGER